MSDRGALHREGRLAFSAVGVLALFAVVAGLSIGPYLLPAVLLLGAGARATPLGKRTQS